MLSIRKNFCPPKYFTNFLFFLEKYFNQPNPSSLWLSSNSISESPNDVTRDDFTFGAW